MMTVHAGGPSAVQVSANGEANNKKSMPTAESVEAAMNPLIEQSLTSVKHPLNSAWTLWYFKNDRTKDWSENLREVITFDTVEDFWAIYTHVELASRLSVFSDYSLFKRGVKPMWEDPANAKGGKWVINLEKRQRIQLLDEIWLEILMFLIGENYNNDDSASLVNGAVVNIRNRGDKISLWIGSHEMAAPVMAIGQQLKDRLGLGREIILSFEAHEDSKQKTGSMAKSKYVV